MIHLETASTDHSKAGGFIFRRRRSCLVRTQGSSAPLLGKFLIVTLLGGGVMVAASGCSRPAPGPDKQFAGTLGGAASGAGAGAITGFQLGAGSGPGAAVGAGLGAAVGAIRGAVQDDLEDQMFALADATQEERATAVAREILSDHYARRLELHPTRDIFPADLFFKGDSPTLRPSGLVVVKELARMNKERLPWSRMAIASYVKSTDPEAFFAKSLAERRSKEIVNQLVRAGLEPRRLEARGVVVAAPVLIDPEDDPWRYSQAIELIPLDR